MKPAATASILALCLLAACRDEPAPAPPAAGMPPASTQDTATPALDQPAEDIPPATAPGAAEALERSPGPPAGTPDGDRNLAGFDGYGQLRFGTPAEAMEEAWGGELHELGREQNPDCYFMTPTWVRTPAEFNFMIVEGRFARFGTDRDTFVAPGGGKVGMDRAEIERLYAGRIEERPHKYTDGAYLRIADPGGGDGVLLFETSGRDAGAKVTEWRVGVPPAVDYVEGCA